MAIRITDTITIDDNELHCDFICSSGPGGQNVNKVATAVQLRFDVQKSTSLTQEIKKRVMHIAGKKMTSDGILVITARRFRHQGQNREDAIARLVEILQKAAHRPKKRIRTAPSSAVREERLKGKRMRAMLKGRRCTRIGSCDD